MKIVGWGNSKIGSIGSAYSRYRNRHAGLKDGVEFVSKHPDKFGRRRVYRKVGKKLVPVGYENIYLNYHGKDVMQESYFRKIYKKKGRRRL